MAAGVVLFYAWITLLHCGFVGICLYAVLGHRLVRLPRMVAIALCAAALGAIETYWIPFAEAAGASLTTAHGSLHRIFGIGGETDIIPLLYPRVWSPAVWMAQGWAAAMLGRYVYRRALRKNAAAQRPDTRGGPTDTRTARHPSGPA